MAAGIAIAAIFLAVSAIVTLVIMNKAYNELSKELEKSNKRKYKN